MYQPSVTAMVMRFQALGVMKNKEGMIMKKNILSLAALLIASATFVACSSSDDSIIEEPQQPAGTKTYTMTVQASKGMETKALELDGSTLNALFADDEGRGTVNTRMRLITRYII